MKEFSHLEVRLIRNPEWLEQFEKKGWFLSEELPIGEFDLPDCFKNMEENDLDELKLWLSKSAIIIQRFYNIKIPKPEVRGATEK